MQDLTKLPPPPKGQTGVTLDSLKHLPPPPAGQKGMTLDQVKAENPQNTFNSDLNAVQNNPNVPSFVKGIAKGAGYIDNLIGFDKPASYVKEKLGYGAKGATPTTGRQALAGAAETGITLAGGIEGSALLKGASLAGKVAKGVGAGYAYDVASNNAEGQTGAKSFTPGIGTAVGAGAPLLGKAVKALIPKTATENALNKISQVAENMTPTEKKQAIDEGRQVISKTITGKEKVDYKPSKEIQRASELLSDTLKKGDRENIVVSKVKDKIKELGQGAETYLKDNIKLIPQKIRDARINTLRNNASESLSKTDMKYYDEQISLFKKQLDKQPENTYGWYKALKEWETKVGENIPKGKEALMGDVSASGKIRAAKDIRTGVREQISQEHPEFSGKMYDLMSLYHAKDVSIINASKLKSTSLFERNPKTGSLLKKVGYVGGVGVVGGLGYSKLTH